MSFLCCCGSNNVKAIRPLAISSDIHLETYGQLKKSKTNNRKQTPSKPNKGPNKQQQRKAETRPITLKQDTAKRNDQNGNKVQVQKQTIAIQAGSPLCKTRNQKTKTTLSYSNEDDDTTSKNPFHRLSKKTDLTPQQNLKDTPKVLRPLKQIALNKRLTSNKKGGDIVLEPIDVSIPKKLVPVDKDFLKRLEKKVDASQIPETQATSSAPIMITTKMIDKSKQKKVQPISIAKYPESSVKTSSRTPSPSEPEEPATMALAINDVEQPVASLSQGTEISQKRDSDNDLYNDDELDLMSQIEKEFANLP